MCGIAGFLSQPGTQSAEFLTEIAGNMAEVQQHRGPDDQGTWCDASSGIALGHRRLAILDLSEQGHQPILSSCGGHVLVYNGEIYNYRELRAELEQAGRRFRGHSDTEVLSEALAEWGVERTLPRLRGMFAFAVWDRREKRLTLVRDRLGIKPLYYGWMGNTLLFGSELKALRQHPEFQANIDPRGVALQLRHNYIPAPYSIYQQVHKLPAGMLLEVSHHGEESPGTPPAPRRWWSLEDVIRRGRLQPFQGDYAEGVEQLDQMLREAVSLRMLADVPVGAFLSGGVDSSLIVAHMQALSSRPIKTFTIGFTEYEYDEAPYARRISEHLGTDHSELCVMPSETQSVIPRLPAMFDEPFSDMSQIPTYLISKLARREVTVSLSGDGGDELFGGYHRYHHQARIWQQLRRIPGRKLLSRSLNWYLRNSPLTWKQKTAAFYADLLSLDTADQLYARLHGHWQPATLMGTSVSDPSRELGFGTAVAGLQSLPFNWMALDTLTYLPEDILTKLDRTSMAVSLEARVPLIDHQVVEFAWSLPEDFRCQQGQGKRILQSVLERHVPRSLFDRPKVGFGIPIGDWLRGSLCDWADDLLSPTRLQAHGFFQVAPIQQLWQEHLSSTANWEYLLWDVLMFQAWYAEYHA